MASPPSPKYLFKILSEAPPTPLLDKLPSTDLDTKDGFIHLSTGRQTPITAKLFFADHIRLWILKLDPQALDGRVEYSTEPRAGFENGCAHLHDSLNGLGAANIVEVVEAVKKPGGEWAECAEMMRLAKYE